MKIMQIKDEEINSGKMRKGIQKPRDMPPSFIHA